MKQRAVLGIMLTLLFIGMLTLAFNIQPVKASLTVHNIDTGEDFATIQEAINDNETLDRHTILVDAGTYYEHVIVNKSISLIGEDKSTTIIDGNETGRVVVITANHVTVSSFTIQKSGNSWSEAGIYIRGHNSNITNNNMVNNRHGVFLEYYSNSIISENNITANVEQGIWLAYSSNNTISGNNIAHGGYVGDGIHLWYSSSNSIVENDITANVGYGVRLAYSSHNMLKGNSIADNTYNFEVAGNTLSHFIQEIDTSNTVDGKPVYYWINRRDLPVPLDAGYVALINCTRIKVKNLNLTKNGQGILLAYTANSSITQNNEKGIYLWQSSKNAISGNKITNNGHGYGIHLEHSLNNTISRNDVTTHWYGIYLVNSLHNTMSGNNITANEYGIYLSKSSNNSISRDNITNNKYGIKLYASSNNIISGNNIANNTWIGINFHESPNNIIAENNITNNPTGIWVEGRSSINNSILRNNIANNGYSIYLAYSPNNTIYHNNFVNNRNRQAYLTSVWDDGYPSGGNYWSDYNSTDLLSGPYQNITGSDGIGDTSYYIDENNQDNYPLMGMFSSFPISYQEEAYDVDVICNSTISSFEFDHENRIIDFDVTGPDDTIGFCRIVIPRALIESPYTILIDEQEIPYTELPISNITHAFLFFTYSHSIHHIKIFTSPPPPPVGGEVTPIYIPMNNPEMPTLWIWLTTIILSMVLTVVYVKKRKRNTEINS